MRQAKPIADRLWEKVDRRGSEDCWLWTGHSNNQGYGMISTRRGQGPMLAHRVAYEATHGPIPPSLFVCHRCDVPLCCNPAHLFLGSHQANMDDMTSKGRHARGERHGAARLSTQQVQSIRDACRRGANHTAMALQFGVAQSTISRIAAGKRRKDG